jgi:hypothetical protein
MEEQNLLTFDDEVIEQTPKTYFQLEDEVKELKTHITSLEEKIEMLLERTKYMYSPPIFGENFAGFHGEHVDVECSNLMFSYNTSGCTLTIDKKIIRCDKFIGNDEYIVGNGYNKDIYFIHLFRNIKNITFIGPIAGTHSTRYYGILIAFINNNHDITITIPLDNDNIIPVEYIFKHVQFKNILSVHIKETPSSRLFVSSLKKKHRIKFVFN